MELKFKKRQLKIDLYGEEVLLDFPTVGQYRKYLTELTTTDKSEFDVMAKFLEELGLKKDLYESLEPIHLKEIEDALTGVAKK